MNEYLQKSSDEDLQRMCRDIMTLNDTAVWPNGEIPVWVEEACHGVRLSTAHMRNTFAISAVVDEVMRRFIDSKGAVTILSASRFFARIHGFEDGYVTFIEAALGEPGKITEEDIAWAKGEIGEPSQGVDEVLSGQD